MLRRFLRGWPRISGNRLPQHPFHHRRTCHVASHTEVRRPMPEESKQRIQVARVQDHNDACRRGIHQRQGQPTRARQHRTKHRRNQRARPRNRARDTDNQGAQPRDSRRTPLQALPKATEGRARQEFGHLAQHVPASRRSLRHPKPAHHNDRPTSKVWHPLSRTHRGILRGARRKRPNKHGEAQDIARHSTQPDRKPPRELPLPLAEDRRTHIP